MIIFILVCSIIVLPGAVSAATIRINDSLEYNNSSLTLNEEIQNIINAAGNGDTIEFLGSYYEDLSLVINHSLNIITNAQTVITGSKNYIFLINGSSNTNINGFILDNKNGSGIIIQNSDKISISDSKISSINGTGIVISNSSSLNINDNKINNSTTGISINNSANVELKGNSITNNKKNGISIEKSQNIAIIKNQISSNGYDGLSSRNSKNITIYNNSIEKNGNNGITLENSTKTTINKNNINKNQRNGIYSGRNVNDTHIKSNNINDNKEKGIEFDKSGANTYVNGNNITGNAIGININGSSNNLVITQNMITGSVTIPDETSSGIGINFGTNYYYSSTFEVSNNAIYGNKRREVEIYDTTQTVLFGANWYGHSSLNGCNLCPKLQTRLITVKLMQSKTGVYSAVFYDGDDVANLLPSFEVTFKLNNGNLQKVLMVNGIAKSSYKTSLYETNNNVISVKTTFQTQFLDINEDDLKKILSLTNYPINPGSNNPNNGVGTGEGGEGSGKGGNMGSGDSQGIIASTIGISSAPSTSKGSTDPSQDAEGSKKDNDDSKTAQEIFINETSKNPQFWSIIVLSMLLILVIIVYYRNELRKMFKK